MDPITYWRLTLEPGIDNNIRRNHCVRLILMLCISIELIIILKVSGLYVYITVMLFPYCVSSYVLLQISDLKMSSPIDASKKQAVTEGDKG